MQLIARSNQENAVHLGPMKEGTVIVVVARFHYNGEPWLRDITGQEYPEVFFDITED